MRGRPFKMASLGILVPEHAKDGLARLQKTIAEIPGVVAIEKGGPGFFLTAKPESVDDVCGKIGAIEEIKVPTGHVIIVQFISGKQWSRLQSHEVH
jgi:hypothetical protein